MLSIFPAWSPGGFPQDESLHLQPLGPAVPNVHALHVAAEWPQTPHDRGYGEDEAAAAGESAK